MYVTIYLMHWTCIHLALIMLFCSVNVRVRPHIKKQTFETIFLYLLESNIVFSLKYIIEAEMKGTVCLSSQLDYFPIM